MSLARAQGGKKQLIWSLGGEQLMWSLGETLLTAIGRDSVNSVIGRRTINIVIGRDPSHWEEKYLTASLDENYEQSSEIILEETSKFFTTRPHSQTHLQAGER